MGQDAGADSRAKLLARLIQADHSLMGYTDIGRAAFGRAGGVGINVLCVVADVSWDNC
jgi:hypothetical protein